MSLRGALAKPRNKAPVPLVAPSQARYGYTGVGRVDMGALLTCYKQNGTLFQIVSNTAVSIAGVQWKLWRKAASGKKEDRKEVTDHPALTVLNRPNDFMPRQEFIETQQQHVELTGESYWLITKVGGIPYELWPIRPDKMEPIRHPDKFVSGYVYKGPSGERIELGVDEVIFIRMPDPEDLWRGMSPVTTILMDIWSNKYAAEYNAAFFANSAEPGGIITTPETLSDNNFNRLRDQWSEGHRGVGNAHRVAILENGATWNTSSPTQRDMEFTQLRQLSGEVIREAYGYPKPLLGTVEDVNRSNAEAADATFGKRYLMPRLDRLKNALNYDFLPLFGDGSSKRYEFDYESPAKEDQAQEDLHIASRTQVLLSMVEQGFEIEEVCDLLDLPRLKYTKPEPPPQLVAPDAAPNQGAGGAEEMEEEKDAQRQGDPENYLQLLNAMKYQAVAHKDDSTCEPCKEVDGKLYRNLEEARKDFPKDGGYTNCIGVKYGNTCRCAAVRRRGGKK